MTDFRGHSVCPKTLSQKENSRSMREERSPEIWAIINIPLVLAANSSLHKLIDFFFDFSAMQTWPTWLLVMLLFDGDRKKKKEK